MTDKKRIFASLDDYLAPGAGVNRVGRNMANNFFFKALMRYGTFDEYHFFLSNGAHRRLFTSHHESFFKEVGVSDKIRLHDRVDLPEALRQTDYTVFHQSDHVTHLGSLCRIRNSVGVNVPVTGFIHSISYPSYMGRYLELANSGMSPQDAIICSSQCGKQVLGNCFKKIGENLVSDALSVRLEVVPLGINEAPYKKDVQLVRRELGFDEDEVVGLGFGRFSDFDKMDLFPLLQAFKGINPQHKKWRLVLAGAVHDNEYFQILNLWVQALGLKEHVTFIVEPDDEIKNDLFHGCDFFVSIADNPQETFGLTLLEAMAAGTPILASDFDGYRELALEDVGIRVPTLWGQFDNLTQVESIMDPRTFHRYAAQSVVVDVDCLKQALHTMFVDDGFRCEKGIGARKRFEEEFAHRIIIKKLERLWDRLKNEFTPSDRKDDLLQMNVFDTFSHYVTESLKPDDKVRTTGFAKQLLNAGVDYPLLPSMSEIVDMALVKNYMNAAMAPAKVSSLMRTRPMVWKNQYILLWMLKHDLLEMVVDA